MVKVIANWKNCYLVLHILRKELEEKRMLKVVAMTSFSLQRQYSHWILSQIQFLWPLNSFGPFPVNTFVVGSVLVSWSGVQILLENKSSSGFWHQCSVEHTLRNWGMVNSQRTVFALTSKEKDRGQKVKPALASIPLHIMESPVHLLSWFYNLAAGYWTLTI